MASDRSPEQLLDAANKKTFVKHHRRIMDRGLGDHEDSALAGILADLRANAEAVYGDPQRPRRAGKVT